MEQGEQKAARFVFGEFVLDTDEATLTCGCVSIPLAPKEFELLRLLVSRAGRLVHKETLISTVWPDTFVSDSSLLRNISVLRKHLGHNAIRTVPKRGYVFALPVTALPIASEGGDRAARLGGTGLPVSHLADSGTGHGARRVAGSGADSAPANPDPVSKVAQSDAIAAKPRTSRFAQAKIAAASAGAALVFVAVLGLRFPRNHPMRVAGAKPDASDTSITMQAAGGARLFVLNQGAKSVSILNTLSNTVESTVQVPADPRGAAVLPDGSAVYVSLNGANRVVALDTRTYRITANIPVGHNPVGVAANPRPPFVYVANNYSNTLSVIDSKTNAPLRTIHVGSVPTEVAVSPDGTRAIVTNQSGGTVTVIDAMANTVLATIPVGSTPVGIAFTPDSRAAWVTVAGQDEAAIIDIAAMKIVGRAHVGPGPVRVAITPDGRSALLSNFFSNKLTVVDTGSLSSIGEIEVGLNPVGVSFDPAGELAYVVNYGSNSVSVVDLKSRRVIRTLDAGTKPVEVVVLPCYSVPCTPS